MRSAPREWLPLEIAGHASLRATMSGVAQAWSEHWFAHRRAIVGVIDAVAGGALVGDSSRSWRRHGAVLAINTPVGGARLAGWLLDADWDPLLTGLAEQLILETLETAVLGDLCERVRKALGLTDSASGEPQTTLDPLGPDGGAVAELKEAGGGLALRIAIPLAALAAARKSDMPARTPRTRPVETRLAALGQTMIEAQAGLGSVELSLEDLQNLAPGDVLVLNTRLDGLALLTVEGTARPLAQGRVSNTEGRLCLTLEA